MKAETPEEKFNRLQKQIQNLWLKAYPNPDRIGCPGTAEIEDYARRVAAWEETKGQPVEEHVHRCSPCYREFLDARERLRAEDAPTKSRMSWFRRRQLGKTLDKLEDVMESAAQEVCQIRELRRGR